MLILFKQLKEDNKDSPMISINYNNFIVDPGKLCEEAKTYGFPDFL